MKSFSHEIAIASRFEGIPNIVQINQSFFQEDSAFIEMPFYSGGTLRQWIDSHKATPLINKDRVVRKRFFHEILRGLVSLHSSGIVHRDLKPENIFLEESQEDELLHIRIGEFNLSKDDSFHTPFEARRRNNVDVSEGGFVYTAPEVQSQKSIHQRKVDVYFAGLIAFEMYACGSGSKLPFWNESDEEKEKKISSLTIHPSDEGVLDVIRGLLHHNPLKRFDAERGLHAPYFPQTGSIINQPGPSYWDQYSKICRVPVSNDVFAAVERVINQTCLSEYIGDGRDSHGLDHTGYEVVSVERVVHPKSMKAYRLALTHVREDVKEADVGGWRGPMKPLRPLTYNEDLWRELEVDDTVNEALLFHGTNSNSVDIICTTGLDDRVGETKSLLGPGLYFAENSSKADDYCAPCSKEEKKEGSGEREGSEGEEQEEEGGERENICHMFLCRVAIGHAQVKFKPSIDPEKYQSHSERMKAQLSVPRRPDCVRHCATQCHHRLYSSNIAECKRTYKEREPAGQETPYLDRYREYVAYDRNVCYPELLVAFKRVKT